MSTIVGAVGMARRPSGIHTRTHTHTHTHAHTHTHTYTQTPPRTHTNTHTHTHMQLKFENFWTRIRCTPPKSIFSKVSIFIIYTLKLTVRWLLRNSDRMRCLPQKLIFSKVSSFIIYTANLIVRWLLRISDRMRCLPQKSDGQLSKVLIALLRRSIALMAMMCRVW